MAFKPTETDPVIRCVLPKLDDAGNVIVPDANASIKGIVVLSDNASDLDADTGKTAVTPKALNNLKTTINSSIKDTVDQIIQDKINNGEIGGGGETPSNKVNTPTITVSGGNTNVSQYPTFNGSEFSSTATDTHIATEWQILLGSNTDPVWSKTETSASTSITVDTKVLQGSTTYTAKVRYQGANYGWSAWGAIAFTTKEIGKVTTPTITIEGAPNSVDINPTLTGGAFSSTTLDTHIASEFKIEKAGDGTVIWSKSFDSATTSASISEGENVLENSTAYVAKLRYKGQELEWSDWGQIEFTTKEKFTIPDDIGTIEDGTYGVGIAPKSKFESLGLSELPGTRNKNSFQYGLYHLSKEIDHDYDESSGMTYSRIAEVYLKYVPKFYYTFLTDSNGQKLDEAHLIPIAERTGFTLERLKRAQTNAPSNCLVTAPASAFLNTGNANALGFILPRAFIDGGSEKSGFFFANTLGYFTTEFVNSTNTSLTKLYFGSPSETLQTELTPNLIRADGSCTDLYSHWKDIKTLGDFVPLCRKITGCNLASIYMDAAIAMSSFAVGITVDNYNDCAWYKAGNDISPRGINTNGTTDNIDSTVEAISTITSSTGTPFVRAEHYAKTTHNGKINGIGNVNGFLWQPRLGTNGNYDKWMAEQTALASVTRAGDECTITHNFNSSVTSGVKWGDQNMREWYRAQNGDERAFCGVVPCKLSKVLAETGDLRYFGGDVFYRYSGGTAPLVGGLWNGGASAGVFARSYGAWTGSYNSCGVRLAGYPAD